MMIPPAPSAVPWRGLPVKARIIVSPAGMLPLILTETDRFGGTEGADEAVLKLKQLEAAKLVEVQDVTVVRWPRLG